MPIKVLPVPFFSHLDDASGYKSSVLAAVGMCLCFHGVPSKGLAAELWLRSRHKFWFPLTLFNLKILIESFRVCQDSPTIGGTLDDLRQAIDEEKPCILHGFFDRFGHVLVVKGYTNYGVIVNDTAGKWSDRGYQPGVNGEGAIYSYQAIAQLCSPESVKDPKHLAFHRVGALPSV